MIETNNCVDKDALIAYLYGEADRAERTRVEAHLRGCTQCADEVRGLKDVRGTLEAWVPPEAELGFRLVSDAHPELAPGSFWHRLWHPPVWGVAAASVLFLTAAWAITKPELEIGRGEMVLRIGWSDTGSNAEAQPGLEPASRPEAATLEADPLQQLEPLRGTPVAVGPRLRGTVPVQRGADVSSGPTNGAAVPAANDEWLLRAVRQLLREEELIANQRQADLTEMQRAFGEFEVTGAERPRQQLLEYVNRVSAR